MNEMAEAYRKLLEECYASKDRYSESYLCAFSMGVGRKYSGKLLVIGRATNGWVNGFSKQDIDDCKRALEALIPEIGKDSLDWVTKQWGASKGYNTRKSQFWRVSRMLAKCIADNSDDCFAHIGWTNLYKIAPDGGNPSNRLMGVQFERCVDVLRLEIELSKVQNVIFLPGYGWAKPFLDRLGISNQLQPAGYNFVEFASSTRGTNYLVGQHPQGKPERPHCEEILRALASLSSRTVV